jgi:hypothetical protein
MVEFNKEGLRSFFNEVNNSTYYIAQPVAEDIRAADWEYSKVYTKSLVEGITTTSEMTDILMRRGIIGPEFEQRSNELTDKLGEKIEELDKAETPEEKAASALEVSIARDELYQWNQRLNAPLANTCEQMADDARLEFLTSRIIVDDNGEKVWEDFDSYLTEKEQSLANQARFEVMLYLQGLESDFLDKTPEAVAMKELEVLASLESSKDNDKVSKKNDTKNNTSKKTTSTKTKTTKNKKQKK